MTDDLIAAFLQKTNGDASIQEKIKEAKDIDAVIDIAKSAGFNISADQFAKAKSEMTDNELETATGGRGFFDQGNYNYRGHNVTHLGKLLEGLL